MKKMKKTIVGGLTLALLQGLPAVQAQESSAAGRVDTIPFGHMDEWVDRQVKESGIIGGATKHVYAIAPTCTLTQNEVYKNMGGSPWGSSNVMARVAGITKTNTSVFPEKRGDGYCARLDTRMESVKVFGLVDITVLAAGSIYLGEMHEPIRGTRNPQKNINSGIPFTLRPTALCFDYKVKMSDREKRIRATGFSRITDVEGKDYPAVILLLQKRWEDADGNLYAKRVGTMVVRYDTTTPDWQNNATYTILYGDITGHPDYKAHMMRLQVEERYAVNSKGESVPIKEVAWGSADETPTHLILQITSSHGGAYIGSPGNSFWIDNVRLLY
ncbi:MAG: PCMD domain-containing protein [Bacteroides sp.]|nr:PCMD domain-containing protein [Bacteroides sp.]